MSERTLRILISKPGLESAGISKVFTPGTSTENISIWVRDNIIPRA